MSHELMNKIAPNNLHNNFYNSRRKNMSILCYNDDMLIEILLRLPAKSLIKFKSVCKQWLSLLSTDQFCHLHTLRHPKPQSSLILRPYKTSDFFYFDPILNPHKLIPYTFTVPGTKRVLSSCNGLLILQSDQPETSYYVYNPTTRRSRKISLTLTNSDKYPNVLGLHLAFDPSISSHYKIVCVRSATEPFSGDGMCCRIDVFESESSIWKLCLDPFTALCGCFSSGVYWKNAIHFCHYPLYYFDTDKHVIVNMPPEPVTPWPRPRPSGTTEGHAAIIPFQESNGHLYRIGHLQTRHADDLVAVYELQDDYSQWLMKYHDEFGCQLPRPVDPLRFIQGDDGETFVYHVSGKIMAYSFFHKRSEELVDLTDQPFYQKGSVPFYYSMVHQFGESMALV